ncbi:hypothetical protein, partial [Trichormus sp. NMC-1]|uniref:hypothetical protein n=1 Tax=Trichormus sp. NMC-1 TaxID=1853259 RepID=UPI001F31270C
HAKAQRRKWQSSEWIDVETENFPSLPICLTVKFVVYSDLRVNEPHLTAVSALMKYILAPSSLAGRGLGVG